MSSFHLWFPLLQTRISITPIKPLDTSPDSCLGVGGAVLCRNDDIAFASSLVGRPPALLLHHPTGNPNQLSVRVVTSLHWETEHSASDHIAVRMKQSLPEEQKDDIDPVGAKVMVIETLLSSDPPDVVDRLKHMCVLPGGLINNSLRKKVWPRMLGITREELGKDKPADDLLETHRDWRVVELDVERLLKRYPPDLSVDKRKALEASLKRIIMRTLYGTDYYYYQGFHDIAITIQLVLDDEDMSVAILKKLCDTHLRVLMMPTLVETVGVLQYIYPLLKRGNAELHDFLVRSNIGTMFALPWLITWYGHNIQENVPYSLVVRLCDLFVASDPYLPMYVGAAIVLDLSEEIFQLPEDQAEVHMFLNNLPVSLPWESLISHALDLYSEYPPASIAAEAATYDPQHMDRRARQRPKKAALAGQDNQNLWLAAGVALSVAVLVVAIGVAILSSGKKTEQKS
ncbi:hypothetical protein RvY_05281 [Ramazzottius varieornatus]|uniref:Rab-GAP TBC domain-containing protein n=1 Tax=Ramazzottius varieornatus TaxID=947166 RepID=A0A1D1UV37_RAMVA|nr:hypothetical protein RvY_05281 [Ramazzottius varieornatus]